MSFNIVAGVSDIHSGLKGFLSDCSYDERHRYAPLGFGAQGKSSCRSNELQIAAFIWHITFHCCFRRLVSVIEQVF